MAQLTAGRKGVTKLPCPHAKMKDRVRFRPLPAPPTFRVGTLFSTFDTGRRRHTYAITCLDSKNPRKCKQHCAFNWHVNQAVLSAHRWKRVNCYDGKGALRNWYSTKPMSKHELQSYPHVDAKPTHRPLQSTERSTRGKCFQVN